MKNTSVTTSITGAIANITSAVAATLTNASELAVPVCDFVTTNFTLGNVTSSVTSYNPAHCGVYGYYPPLQPLLSFILVFMTVWSLFGNGCLLYLVRTEKNMREPGNILLCALALTDITQILVYAPTTVDSLVHGEIPGEGWCRIQAFIDPFLGTLTVYLQASLWICRYIHIAFPFDYASMITKRRLALIVAICVLIALTAPLIGVARAGTVQSWTVDESSVDIAQPISLMMPCIMGGPEVFLFIVLNIVGVVISCVAASLICKEVLDSENRRQELTGIAKDQMENKLKSAKTLAIMTGVQLITWFPVVIVGLLWKTGGITSDMGSVLGDVSFVVMMTSTFTDSIVFAKRKNIYRRAVGKIYGKIRKRYELQKELQDIPLRNVTVRRYPGRQTSTGSLADSAAQEQSARPVKINAPGSCSPLE
ncbi:G-protein coupled receptor 26-like [Branchiostoma lanceolatum]|uniref:G-protein coupled receptor 26-like n=1 Tax=Branchiostoma lanceolatum TaxID=7740 RepID=UPI003454F4CE